MDCELLIRDIGELLTLEGEGLGSIHDGAVVVDKGSIHWVGKTQDLPKDLHPKEIVSARGKLVSPGLVDAHTHLVFAATREDEYLAKLHGASYLDILAKGGGILSSVEHLRQMSKPELVARSKSWLDRMLGFGVTTVEIKTGYGLNYHSELKMLEVIDDLSRQTPQTIYPTFLGAHTIPKEFRDNPEGYCRELLDRMLPDFKGLAKACDVFLEKGAFDFRQSERILHRAKDLGYDLKIHMNQMNELHGAKLARDLGALSVEHLNVVSSESLDILAQSKAVCVLLPLANYFLREAHSPKARDMIDLGCKLAVATDFNPGSAPSPNLPLAMSFAVHHFGLKPAEAWRAVTLDAARALGLEQKIGSITVGKKAHLVLWDMPSWLYPFYHFGVNWVERVFL